MIRKFGTVNGISELVPGGFIGFQKHTVTSSSDTRTYTHLSGTSVPLPYVTVTHTLGMPVKRAIVLSQYAQTTYSLDNRISGILASSVMSVQSGTAYAVQDTNLINNGTTFSVPVYHPSQSFICFLYTE